MIALQGYFEDDKFIYEEKIKIPYRKKAIVTILDEPATKSNRGKELTQALDKFFSDIASSNEVLIGEPERVNFKRTTLDL